MYTCANAVGSEDELASLTLAEGWDVEACVEETGEEGFAETVTAGLSSDCLK